MNLSKSILLLFSFAFYLHAQNIHRGDGEYGKPKKSRQVDQKDYEKNHQCYWMTNRGNKWVWINAPQGNVNKQRCYELDSCDGGKGQSAGGCYKWAKGPKAKRAPWNYKVTDPKNKHRNLIKNGSFEAKQLKPGQWQVFNKIKGWKPTKSSSIEVQNSSTGPAAHGDQYVELDVHHSNGIYQKVKTTPGKTYRLKFSFASRPNTKAKDNVLIVKVDHKEVFRINGQQESKQKWLDLELIIKAKPSKKGKKTKIEFIDGGASNSVGTYLDNVSMTLVR